MSLWRDRIAMVLEDWNFFDLLLCHAACHEVEGIEATSRVQSTGALSWSANSRRIIGGVVRTQTPAKFKKSFLQRIQ
jgi:hypothetical protein